MSELEDKISNVMNNPELMQQIMKMAQAMSSDEEKTLPPEPPSNEDAFSMPEIDFSMIQKLSGFAKKSGINKEQTALLHALRPYLSTQRINRLERAMKAAKMAGFATTMLGR